MAIAVDEKIPFRYILKSDREKPEPERTIFHIKPATRRDMRDILSRGRSQDGGVKFNEVEILDFLERYIVGWENFKNSNGELISFDSKKENNLDYLSLHDLRELFEAAMELNQLGETNEKN